MKTLNWAAWISAAMGIGIGAMSVAGDPTTQPEHAASQPMLAVLDIACEHCASCA
jgi:hypothetical protein